MNWVDVLVTSGVSVVVTVSTLLIAAGKYREKILRSEIDITKNCDEIKDINTRLAKLEGGIDRDRAHSPYTETNSPVGLNDKGKALLLDSGGKTYIDAHQDELVKEIQARSPKSAYDVQQAAIEVIKAHADSDDFVPLKNYIFSEGVDLSNLALVMGIALRDIAMEPLGFNPKDLDEQKPVEAR